MDPNWVRSFDRDEPGQRLLGRLIGLLSKYTTYPNSTLGSHRRSRRERLNTSFTPRRTVNRRLDEWITED